MLQKAKEVGTKVEKVAGIKNIREKENTVEKVCMEGAWVQERVWMKP